ERRMMWRSISEQEMGCTEDAHHGIKHAAVISNTWPWGSIDALSSRAEVHV
ncbi:hypothetical protein TorRG33x02_144150, partial [Trema orientale]